jgi:hypothetical protein
MSKFWTLSTRDWLNGLIMAVGSAVLTAVIQLLQTGTSFGTNELKSIALVAIVTGLTYISKKLATDEKGNLLGSKKL